MAVNVYNIKKWYKMLTGKSLLHVNQDLGKQFVPGEIKGYFNNMTEKVTRELGILDSEEMPLITDEKDNKIEFPVAIFQYGLGAYDLYLATNEKRYYVKFLQCVDWAIHHQEEKGAWNNFFFYYPQNPYGAMCQGEGASLLIRAYKSTNDSRYYNAAMKAIDFMLLSVEEGGTTRYNEISPCFLEYTHRPAVLNGWIFALFGLYDFCLVSDNDLYKEVFDRAIQELKKQVRNFTGSLWSVYDLDGRIASPFYHNLHIAQMEALYLITGDEIFKKIYDKWKRQQQNIFCKIYAFIRKAIQKILEK